MTVEEKEAIEKLEYYVENIEIHNFEKTEGFKYIKTALNLIQKQGKIIDKMAEKLSQVPICHFKSKSNTYNPNVFEAVPMTIDEIKEWFERQVEENGD